MSPIGDPAGIDHAALRDLALEAAWVAKLEAAVEAVEDRLLPPGDAAPARGGAVAGADDGDSGDPLAVALEDVEAAYVAAARALEARLLAWLGDDPERWALLFAAVLAPWQAAPEQWRADAPGWVRVLGPEAVLAHGRQNPYGRQWPPGFAR